MAPWLARQMKSGGDLFARGTRSAAPNAPCWAPASPFPQGPRPHASGPPGPACAASDGGRPAVARVRCASLSRCSAAPPRATSCRPGRALGRLLAGPSAFEQILTGQPHAAPPSGVVGVQYWFGARVTSFWKRRNYLQWLALSGWSVPGTLTASWHHRFSGTRNSPVSRYDSFPEGEAVFTSTSLGYPAE